jgi:hypothetical protein
MDPVKQSLKKNITLFIASMMMLFAFAGCGKDNDPQNGDNRTGEPYRIRVELSCDEGEDLKIIIGFANYNFIEQSGPLKGLPRTEWLIDEKGYTLYDSPCVKEFEVVRHFNKFTLLAGVHAILSDEILRTKNIHGKVFVNNNLLVSSSFKYDWGCVIDYDSNKKKYVINYSGGTTIEKDKL